MPVPYVPHPDPKKRRPFVNMEFWPRGTKTAVARAAGLHLTSLTTYLKRRTTPCRNIARNLEAATRIVLGPHRCITEPMWQMNLTIDHPAFEALTDTDRRKIKVDQRTRALLIEEAHIASEVKRGLGGSPVTQIKKEVTRRRLLEEAEASWKHEQIRKRMEMERIAHLWGDALIANRKPRKKSLKEKLLAKRKR